MRGPVWQMGYVVSVAMGIPSRIARIASEEYR